MRAVITTKNNNSPERNNPPKSKKNIIRFDNIPLIDNFYIKSKKRIIKTENIIEIKKEMEKKRIENERIDQLWRNLIEQGAIKHNNKLTAREFMEVKDIWKNEPCYVVGCGPSLKEFIDKFGFDILKGKHTIGINHIVEDWDGFEWLIFLDRRFINLTSYNLDKFPGRIFARNSTGFENRAFDYLYKITSKKPTLNIDDGLYNGNLTGLCALHLAIITGANPIYLLGIDCGGGTPKDYHYKSNYTGEVELEGGKVKLTKYKGTAQYFNEFNPWINRIINLSSISNIKTFKKEDMYKHFNNQLVKKINILQNPIICHIIGMDNMDKMGDISRNIFNMKYGRHIYSNINNPEYPKADLYFIESFLQNFEKYKNFTKPNLNAKVISLIHSCLPCTYADNSDAVVFLTETWKRLFEYRNIKKSVIIPGAIDNNIFGNPEPDYSKHTFGRITRSSPAKIHPGYYKMVNNILEKDKLAKCIMITDAPNKIKIISHERLIFDKSIKINETQKKAQVLRELSLYIHAHNGFTEIFSMGILEAMATGLCVIVNEKQDSMKEQLGGTGIFCTSIEEMEKIILELLPDIEHKKELGRKTKQRAMEFSIEKMQQSYENLFREVLNDR
jgi:glycosyltransferase involved in cell wall biosynthesis